MKIALVALAASLIPASASAADCFRQTKVEIGPYSPTVFEPSPDGSVWRIADDRQPGAVILHGHQSATIERDAHRAEVAWSAPPQVWCTDGEVELRATFSGDHGGMVYDSNPVSSIVATVEPTPPIPLTGYGGTKSFFHN